MIFLDANIFLRMLGGGTSPVDEERVRQAFALFDAIRKGEIQATTSEVVLHEVCFILASKHHYGRQPREIIAAMTTLLSLSNLVFPFGDRDVYLRALEMWSGRLTLGFADSVIAARCERAGHQLATFDRHFDEIPTLSRWQPAPVTPGES